MLWPSRIHPALSVYELAVGRTFACRMACRLSGGRFFASRLSMAITFDPLSAIKIDPSTIRFYSLSASIYSFHLQA